jgi:hypothetical protein
MFKNIDKKFFLRSRLIFNLVLFTFVSIKTTFPNLGETKLAFLDISFNSDVRLIRNMYGMSDAGSYLDIALSLAIISARIKIITITINNSFISNNN